MKYDVFISYSRRDYVDKQKNVVPNNEVSKIKEALINAGITYWFDEDGIYSGQNFVEKIVTNIEAAKIFLFLSTANSNKSPWTCKEIASAAELGKHIIPVRIDDSPYNKNVLFRIADLDYIEYYTNPQNGMVALIKSIKAYLAEIAAEEGRKKKEQQRMHAQEQVKTLALEYEKSRLAVDIQGREIQKTLRDLGVTHRVCPVCAYELRLNDKFCPQCAWGISPFDGIECFDYLLERNEQQLRLATRLYNAYKSSDNNENLEKELERSKQTIEELTSKVEKNERALKNKIDAAREKELLIEKRSLQRRLELVSEENKQLASDLTNLRIELAIAKNRMTSCENEKMAINKKLSDSQGEDERLVEQLTDLKSKLAAERKAGLSNTQSNPQAQKRNQNELVHNGHEYVDLGLSVKWATCNVGATKPEDSGDYFAWGETAPKSNYSWSTYKYCKGTFDTMTKYCTKGSFEMGGKIFLELSDDAACVNWGGNWRMPTENEWTELRQNCNWAWTSQSGVKGYIVTSNINKNSIFLPAPGSRVGVSVNNGGFYGYYWSNSLITGPFYDASYAMIFYRGGEGLFSGKRYLGCSIRAVCP